MGHIHKDNQYDYTVSAVIVHKDKVLLLFHHKLHLWLPPAGHIELNETPVEALYREILEETGLSTEHLTLINTFSENMAIDHDPEQNVILPIPFNINTHQVTEAGHRHIDLSYILTSDTDKVRKEKDGAEKLEWFTLDEIASLSPMPKITYGHAKYGLEKAHSLTR